MKSTRLEENIENNFETGLFKETGFNLEYRLQIYQLQLLQQHKISESIDVSQYSLESKIGMSDLLIAQMDNF